MIVQEIEKHKVDMTKKGTEESEEEINFYP